MLAAGTHLGPYEILAPLGGGGMGEVYRARDNRLGRDVAIKVLLQHLSDDPDLKQRFEREAKAISQLTHPHIGTLYDIGNENGLDFLVLELLEGQTLAERLEKGALPLDRVLKCGVEIAEALDKAHRASITHRDLKPGNIMLTKAGVKLLDFGLAKFQSSNDPDAVVTSLPTEAARPLTEKGTLLGTVQYMAPEQLEGREADARTDIFALGCVLYEMATAQRPFTGKSRVSLISSILRDDPQPISRIAPMTPPAFDRLVKTCLAKDPDDRVQTAHDVKLQLQWIAEAGSQAGAPAVVLSKRRNLERLAWGVAAGVALLALGLGMLLVRANRRVAAQEQTVVRTSFLPPRGERLVVAGTGAFGRAFALSPDGSRLVYVVRTGVTSELRLRALGSAESITIPGTEGAMNPFFAPDGKWVGFTAGPKLKKVALAGGTPMTLCDAPVFRGAAWGEDGSIYFVPNMYVPISRISAAGGVPQPVTKIRTADGEQLHRWPELLPGGKVLLYVIGSGGEWDDATIVAEHLATGARTVLVKGGTTPRYLPTGHLVYARAEALYALAFDTASLKTEGAPVEVARNVLINSSGSAQADVSRSGTLVTAPADASGGDRMLSWIDREGRSDPLRVPRQPYDLPMLSPDGNRVVLNIGNSIAVLDLAKLLITKITLPARAEEPTWSPDGRRIYFGLEHDKYYQVWWKSADDTGAPQLLFPSDTEEDPYRVSPDGSQLLTVRTVPDGLSELCLRSMSAGASPEERRVLYKSLFLEGSAAGFSPDARWVTYQSRESGRSEIYVRPASGADRKWQVSTEGGAVPVWSPAGEEIFYLCGSKFMAAPVGGTAEEFSSGTPRVLFENHEINSFDVSRDGRKFLVAEDPNPGAPPSLDLTVNWFAEVRRKVREAKAP